MQTEIPLPYYLQQYKVTKTHFTNFTKIPNNRITSNDKESVPYGWIIFYI